MGSFKFTRPASIEFPKVWAECETESGIRYRIQDIPPEMHQQIIEHMTKHFLPDETSSRCIRAWEEPKAIEDFRNRWMTALASQISLMAVSEDGILLGCMLLRVRQQGEPVRVDQFLSKTFRMLARLWLVELMESANVFQRYNVDMYMCAGGMSVHAKYRNQGIASELLKAREKVCRAMGIPAAGDTFSGEASQRAAAKAGYEVLAEIAYDDYTVDNERIFSKCPSRYCKFMAKKFV